VLLEKAYAKVRGSYTNATGGLLNNGLRVLTNDPVFEVSTIMLTEADNLEK